MPHDYSNATRLAKNLIDEYVLEPSRVKLSILDNGFKTLVDHFKSVLDQKEADENALKAKLAAPRKNYEKGDKVVYIGGPSTDYNTSELYTVIGRMVKPGTNEATNIVVANAAGYNIGKLVAASSFRPATGYELLSGRATVSGCFAAPLLKVPVKCEETADTLACYPVDSTLIKSFKWFKTLDKFKDVLEVTLLTSPTSYFYQGVPKHVVSKWIEVVKAGSSPGGYYNAHIKGIYTTFTAAEMTPPLKAATLGFSHFERVVPSSSFIAKIQWFSQVCDGTKNVLRVDFKDLSSVLYESVSKDIYDLWVRAIEVGSSSGVFYNMNVKGRYAVLNGTEPAAPAPKKAAPKLRTTYEGTLFKGKVVDEFNKELKVGDVVVSTAETEGNLKHGFPYKIAKIEDPKDTKTMKEYQGYVLHLRNGKGHCVGCLSSTVAKKV